MVGFLWDRDYTRSPRPELFPTNSGEVRFGSVGATTFKMEHIPLEENMRPVILFASAALILLACGGDDVELEGDRIPVEGDPAGATYQLIEWSELPDGNREALTRRDGTSGTSYARREIDCEGQEHRYLGEGQSREQAQEDYPSPNEMTELVPGSISSEISEFVCRK